MFKDHRPEVYLPQIILGCLLHFGSQVFQMSLVTSLLGIFGMVIGLVGLITLAIDWKARTDSVWMGIFMFVVGIVVYAMLGTIFLQVMH